MVLGCQDEGCSSSPLLTEETSPFCFSPSLSVQWPWRRGARTPPQQESEGHRLPTQLVWLCRHLWAGTSCAGLLRLASLQGPKPALHTTGWTLIYGTDWPRLDSHKKLIPTELFGLDSHRLNQGGE